MLRLAALLALLVVATGCDSTETYPLGGDNVAVFFEGEGTTTSTISLPDVETGESFSFSVTVRTAVDDNIVENFSATGTGTYTYPDISLTIDGDTTAGTVNEAGTTITIVDDGDTLVFRLQEV